MRLSGHVLATDPPPLSPFMSRARVLRNEGKDIIVLAQAVVDYSPPETFTSSLSAALAGKDMLVHLYSPDAGRADLRQALSQYLAATFDIAAEPESEIIVTPGANHAAYQALSAILAPGDEALLITPWYFNHEMTVKLLGARVRTVAARAENGFIPQVEEILEAWTPKLRVLVLVNPNNPTGAIYPDEWIKELARGLAADQRWRDVWLLSDQTYHEIFFAHEHPLSPASLSYLRERTVTVGSFSKSLALAGWRLGFMAGPAALINEVLKIQDSSVICAANASQMALAETLNDKEALGRYFNEKRKLLRGRRDALLNPIREDDRWRIEQPDGACFAFARLPESYSGEEFCWQLLESGGVAVVPGCHFGPGGEQYLRLSFGTGSEDILARAGRRIREFSNR